MSIRLALMAATGTLALGVASAQTDEGFYGTLGVGAAFETDNNDFQSDGNATPFEFDTELETDIGASVYGAIGKYFDHGLRGEFEVAYRNQDLDGFPGGAGFGGIQDPGNTLGDVAVFTGMVNVIKDFDIDLAGRINPYIGAGIGFARIRMEFDNLAHRDPANFPVAEDLYNAGYRAFVANDDYVTAAQGLAGVGIDLTEKLTLDLGYRFLQTGEYDFEGFINNEVADLSGEYRVHEATIGLRFDFGGASSAAPAVITAVAAESATTKTCFDGTEVAVSAPCPTPAEDKLTPAELATIVYFELNSSQLTSANRALLQRRAEEASNLEIVEIVVTGNTDTSGTAQYNKDLSARRAEVVRRALVAYGLDGSKIRVRALGESSLAEPTKDGVREPLNRRTEVEFDF